MYASMHAKKLKALILVLGLLQVVGTVKILNYSGASRNIIYRRIIHTNRKNSDNIRVH